MNITKWYALKVRGGKEEKVKESIEEAIVKEKLSPYFDQIILPFEKVYLTQKGKQKMKKSYLSYLFISLDLEGGKNSKKDIKQVISEVGGVYGFVGASGWKGNQDPIPVGSQEIDKMLGKAQEGTNVKDGADQIFVKKEMIKIIDGPLKGFEATVQEVVPKQKMLKVYISCFGRPTPADVSYAQAQKINHHVREKSHSYR